MLAIPATSVPRKRLFAKAGDILTKKRNRFAPSKADRVVFLMDNLWQEISSELAVDAIDI